MVYFLLRNASIPEIKLPHHAQNPHVHRKRLVFLKTIQENAVCNFLADPGKSDHAFFGFFVASAADHFEAAGIRGYKLGRMQQKRRAVAEAELAERAFVERRYLFSRRKCRGAINCAPTSYKMSHQILPDPLNALDVIIRRKDEARQRFPRVLSDQAKAAKTEGRLQTNFFGQNRIDWLEIPV